MTDLKDQSPITSENLTAYLDGELDDALTEEVERSLSQSPDARREVDVLTRVWDMLDELPETSASDEFTARTRSTIQVEDVDTQPHGGKQDWATRTRRGAKFVVAASGLAMAAGLGFFATHQWIPTKTDRMVQELPLIEHLDLYAEVGTVDFLRELEQSGLFDAENEDSSDDRVAE